MGSEKHERGLANSARIPCRVGPFVPSDDLSFVFVFRILVNNIESVELLINLPRQIRESTGTL
jgi:hypothetical protein